MADITEIANIALTNLGAENITDYTEYSTSANRIRSVFNNLRKAVLQEHPWNFAIARKVLSPLSEIPEFEFSNKFELPTDYLRVIGAFSDSSCYSSVNYKVEGREILANTNVVYLKYIKNTEDYTLFTDLFVQALSARISYELCFPITNSYNVQESMYKLYISKLNLARSIDSLEGTPEKIDDEGDGTWIGARY